MLQFDWFVLPFTLGLCILLVTLAVKYTYWIKNLPKDERLKVKKGVFSVKSFEATWEVFTECLLHRKIFKVNPLLGYMHASLAFGWFLLILVGNWESRVFYHGHLSPPYLPIFFRFFNPNPDNFVYEGVFAFTMDFTLLVVLSGVALAWIKRISSRLLGMKKTTVLRLGDQLALSSLWFIFPLRFLAESFTSANMGGGHFLTSTAGSFFGGFLPVQHLAYPAWWAYSLSLGMFFIAVPYSRYMHIPTEVLLIFLRKYGVAEKKDFTTYSRVEVNSCSRCGVCIDPCQLASASGLKDLQSVYYLQDVRNGCINDEKSLNCLMCGRCDTICPVGVDIKSVRMAGRRQINHHKTEVFSYLPPSNPSKADVVYFAGCMTHLQPSVKKSMVGLMSAAKEKFLFMDEAGSICCGRPLMLAGKEAQARELITKNKAMIEASGAKTMVTSCPICYKVFNEEYQLNIEVLHHSEFLLRLLKSKKLKVAHQHLRAVYHDPCELGRGAGIFNQPRELLNEVVNLVATGQERENALCCGGSLANLTIANDARKKVTAGAIKELMVANPDLLVTGCPLCKKTFAQAAPVQVKDIAEVLFNALTHQAHLKAKEIKVSEKIPEGIEAMG